MFSKIFYMIRPPLGREVWNKNGKVCDSDENKEDPSSYLASYYNGMDPYISKYVPVNDGKVVPIHCVAQMASCRGNHHFLPL